MVAEAGWNGMAAKPLSAKLTWVFKQVAQGKKKPHQRIDATRARCLVGGPPPRPLGLGEPIMLGKDCLGHQSSGKVPGACLTGAGHPLQSNGLKRMNGVIWGCHGPMGGGYHIMLEFPAHRFHAVVHRIDQPVLRTECDVPWWRLPCHGVAPYYIGS